MLRILYIITNKIFLAYQMYQQVKDHRRFREHLTPKIRRAMAQGFLNDTTDSLTMFN